jgi:glutaredoxin
MAAKGRTRGRRARSYRRARRARKAAAQTGDRSPRITDSFSAQIHVSPACHLLGEPATRQIRISSCGCANHGALMSLTKGLAAFRAIPKPVVPRTTRLPGFTNRCTAQPQSSSRPAPRSARSRPGIARRSSHSKDANGRDVSLGELPAKGPLVVTFYRGVWCPYCNLDLQALQDALPAITERGAQLVAISPQTQPNSRKSQRDNRVTFPILSDPGNEIVARFGPRFRLPDYLIEISRRDCPMGSPSRGSPRRRSRR